MPYYTMNINTDVTNEREQRQSVGFLSVSQISHIVAVYTHS